MSRTKLPIARKMKMHVAQVDILPAKGLIDKIVDALALAWNDQEYDKQAFEFFMEPIWGQQEILLASLYRYPEGTRLSVGDREFLARQLKLFADVVYASVGRWL